MYEGMNEDPRANRAQCVMLVVHFLLVFMREKIRQTQSTTRYPFSKRQQQQQKHLLNISQNLQTAKSNNIKQRQTTNNHDL